MHRLLKTVSGVPSSVASSRLMWAFSMIKAGLWLAAGLVSALLVYWLHFKPVYEEDWTSSAGSVFCAGLSICAVIGCLNNLGAAFSGPGKSSQRPLQR
jgi:hypothetical protein